MEPMGSAGLAELRVFDNSIEGDPASGAAPTPTLVLHMKGGTIMNPEDLARTPEWAKPIVAAGMMVHAAR